VSSVVGKGGLAKMDREMAVVVTCPSKCSTKEVVYVTHKIDCKLGGEQGAEELFFSWIGGVKYEVINI